MRIAIIGAGLIGVSTAYHLSRLGHQVIVIERGTGPGLETSFANGGMLTPSQADPWNSPGILYRLLGWLGREDAPVLLRPSKIPGLLRWGLAFLRNSTAARFRANLVRNATLANYSLACLRALRDETGIEYAASTRGTMRLFREDRELALSLEMCALLNDLEIGWKLLTPREVTVREPALAPIESEIKGGIFYPDDESGDAYLFCTELAKRAGETGVQFRYGTTVTGWHIEGGAIRAVLTDGGPVQAEKFVLAAGSYSPLLASRLGVRIPVRPVKGYSLTLDMAGWKIPPAIPIVDDTFHAAATPLGTRMRVAGTAEFAGYDTRVSEARAANLMRFISGLYPAERGAITASPAVKWAGLRPYACDGVPILGGCAVPNLLLNTGHGHLGWSMAAGSGRAIADLITRGSADIDLSPFRVDRF